MGDVVGALDLGPEGGKFEPWPLHSLHPGV